MDFLHSTGVSGIQFLQNVFKDQSELMLQLSHLGDPRNAFLLYFPLSFCLHKATGEKVLWLACLAEWINAILKWVLFGQRPYWWVHETEVYQGKGIPVLQQYSLTCETGPGSPSGHVMVTSSVMFCMVVSFIKIKKLKMLGQILCWGIFVCMMLAVCVSRCYIATHFPHQVLFGVIVGILLTVSFSQIETESFGLKQYFITSLLIISTCVATFFMMKGVGLDPQWSIDAATKWCARSEWVYWDTTPFNAIFRDAGSILGYGIYHYLFLTTKTIDPTEEDGLYVKGLHCILSLILCVFVENLKLPKETNIVWFYCFTFSKFCILTLAVAMVTKLFLRHNGGGGKTMKQC